MKKKIYILGSAYPFRGGLASFNERLAEQFLQEGNDVKMDTFTIQYPDILFPGKTQYSTSKAPEGLHIERCVNSINPFNWIKVGQRIRKEKPDILIIKYWMPFMAPCLGSIARLVRKNKYTRVICIVDNMIPHEKHFYDTILSKYFVGAVDAFVAMSESVQEDVQMFTKNPCVLTPHPMFDNFGKIISRGQALQALNLSETDRYLLYFGFIRHYKGLDILIQAFSDSRLRKYPLKLIIAGEFYEDAKPYMDLIKSLGLEDKIILKGDFIPNEEVANYFCAADLLVLPYRDATQSGVTQISYYFGKPMLVTKVGGLPEIVPDGKAGYVVEPTPICVADALVDFCENKTPDYFNLSIKEERKRFEWAVMTKKIIQS